MKIIKAKYILRCDESFEVLKDSAICFDEKIISFGDEKSLKKSYPDSEFIDIKDAVLMPGLINTHTHLEFSSNRATLKFGSFIDWLKSVIEYREELLEESKRGLLMSRAIDEMRESGITTIGAISSFGEDFEACLNSDINVVYFSEVLGSDPVAVDLMYQDFLSRYNRAKSVASKRFIPAVSIHSPYSTHPILAKKVLSLAKDNDCVVSTHFLESLAEREWLEESRGEFREFFESFKKDAKALIKPLEYIELFKDSKALFTHLCYADDKELEAISLIGASITHCPRSNRYLGSRLLELENIDKFNLATDGLSSNDSLSLWDEMRASLMLHHKAPLNLFAKKLLKATTNYAAKALFLNKGILKEGYDSDLIILDLPKGLKDESDLAYYLILKTHKVKDIYIDGKKLKSS